MVYAGTILDVIPRKPKPPAITLGVEEALLMSGRDLSAEELFALAAWPLERFSDEEMKAVCVPDDLRNRNR